MKYLPSGSKFLIGLLIIVIILSAILPSLGFGGLMSEGFSGLTSYSTVDGHRPIDTLNSNLIDAEQDRQCKKIHGFNGLFCDPAVERGGIDVMYGLPSNMNCAGSGLTKSGGNLCLNDSTHQLMTTRGGNSTGANSTTGTKDSVIG